MRRVHRAVSMRLPNAARASWFHASIAGGVLALTGSRMRRLPEVDGRWEFLQTARREVSHHYHHHRLQWLQHCLRAIMLNVVRKTVLSPPTAVTLSSGFPLSSRAGKEHLLMQKRRSQQSGNEHRQERFSWERKRERSSAQKRENGISVIGFSRQMAHDAYWLRSFPLHRERFVSGMHAHFLSFSQRNDGKRQTSLLTPATLRSQYAGHDHNSSDVRWHYREKSGVTDTAVERRIDMQLPRALMRLLNRTERGLRQAERQRPGDVAVAGRIARIIPRGSVQDGRGMTALSSHKKSLTSLEHGKEEPETRDTSPMTMHSRIFNPLKIKGLSTELSIDFPSAPASRSFLSYVMQERRVNTPHFHFHYQEGLPHNGKNAQTLRRFAPFGVRPEDGAPMTRIASRWESCRRITQAYTIGSHTSLLLSNGKAKLGAMARKQAEISASLRVSPLTHLFVDTASPLPVPVVNDGRTQHRPPVSMLSKLNNYRSRSPAAFSYRQANQPTQVDMETRVQHIERKVQTKVMHEITHGRTAQEQLRKTMTEAVLSPQMVRSLAERIYSTFEKRAGIERYRQGRR